MNTTEYTPTKPQMGARDPTTPPMSPDHFEETTCCTTKVVPVYNTPPPAPVRGPPPPPPTTGDSLTPPNMTQDVTPFANPHDTLENLSVIVNERLVAWKSVLKALQQYFENILASQGRTAEAYKRGARLLSYIPGVLPMTDLTPEEVVAKASTVASEDPRNGGVAASGVGAAGGVGAGSFLARDTRGGKTAVFDETSVVFNMVARLTLYSDMKAQQHAQKGRLIAEEVLNVIERLLNVIKTMRNEFRGHHDRHTLRERTDFGRRVSRLSEALEIRRRCLCEGGLGNDELAARAERGGGIAAKIMPNSHRDLMEDPWLVNEEIRNFIQTRHDQMKYEHTEAKNQQDTYAEFEIRLIDQLRAVLLKYFQHEARDVLESERELQEVNRIIEKLQGDVEWNRVFHKCKRFPYSYPSGAPGDGGGDIQPEYVNYTGKEHPLVGVVYAAPLERLSGMLTKSYKPEFYVLSKAGFLHGFPPEVEERFAVNGAGHEQPDVTIDLANSTLHPRNENEGDFDEFEIHERKDGGMLSKGTSVNVFRGRSKPEAAQWWNHLELFCEKVIKVEHPITPISCERIPPTKTAEGYMQPRPSGNTAGNGDNDMVIRKDDQGGMNGQENAMGNGTNGMGYGGEMVRE